MHQEAAIGAGSDTHRSTRNFPFAHRGFCQGTPRASSVVHVPRLPAHGSARIPARPQTPRRPPFSRERPRSHRAGGERREGAGRAPPAGGAKAQAPQAPRQRRCAPVARPGNPRSAAAPGPAERLGRLPDGAEQRRRDSNDCRPAAQPAPALRLVPRGTAEIAALAEAARGDPSVRTRRRRGGRRGAASGGSAPARRSGRKAAAAQLRANPNPRTSPSV